MTAQNAFHFLPWNRYCMYTLGMEEKEKVSAGRREMDAKRNYEALSPATLNPFHILSFYAFLWTPLVENYIFGDLKSPLMHFSGLAVPFCKGVSWRGRGRKEANLKKERTKRRGEKENMYYSPVTWSTRMREVMMRPYWEKSCSSSFWVMVFGKPLTYKFASLMEAELGRA